jgi:hypothetical protein
MATYALPVIVVAALVAWPVTLGAALVDRMHAPLTVGGALVYGSAALVCHQRPDRSYTSGGVGWPVCARCAGIYLGGAAGALGAAAVRRRRRVDLGRLRRVVIGCVAIAAAAWLAEALRLLDVPAVWRTVTAIPAGGALAGAVVIMAWPEAGSGKSIG